MKKIMLTIFMILLTFMMSSCQVKPNEIPLIIYDMNDNYMSDFEQKIKDASGDINYKTYDSQNSQIIQNEIFESLLEQGYKTFVINPVDRLSVYALIEKAEQKDATIVFINREPLESDMNLSDKVYYLGADAAQSGRLQAELVMELFGSNPEALNQYDKNGDNKIQAVILKGEQGHQDAEQRTQVVIDDLTDNLYDVDVLEIKIANFDMQEASIATEELLNTYGDQIEVVLANNDAMAVGAIETLKAQDYFVDTNQDGVINRQTETWMPVIGIDGLDIAIEQIEKGYLYGTVLNDSITMAEALSELVGLIINGEDINQLSYGITNDKYIWIDYQKLTFS